ncbi:MAG: hypothetical protein JO323_16110 [Acidobacteriia bacterium]|nr:hypothetical protein [Terriglobia bacterium]
MSIDPQLAREGSAYQEPDILRIQGLVNTLLPDIEPELALTIEQLLLFAYLKGRQDLCVYLHLANQEIQERVREIRNLA